MSVTRRSSRQAACLVFGVISLATLTAQAQTLDGKAPANGKVMSFNELKACIVQQETLKTRRTSLEADRAKLDGERAEIEKGSAALKVEREELTKRNDMIKAFNEKMKAFSAKVDEFKEKGESIKDGSLTGRNLERRQRELAREEAALQAEDEALKKEGEAVKAATDPAFVDQLNARIDAQTRRANEWNARSKAVDDASAKYEDDRVDWRANCGDRRYREDDEKLIRADLAKGK